MRYHLASELIAQLISLRLLIPVWRSATTAAARSEFPCESRKGVKREVEAADQSGKELPANDRGGTDARA
jgi:hypothetical protein